MHTNVIEAIVTACILYWICNQHNHMWMLFGTDMHISFGDIYMNSLIMDNKSHLNLCYGLQLFPRHILWFVYHTLLLLRCILCFTPVYIECYSVYIVCYSSVYGVLLRCILRVSPVYSACYSGVYCVLLRCILCVTPVYIVCYSGVYCAVLTCVGLSWNQQQRTERVSEKESDGAVVRTSAVTSR